MVINKIKNQINTYYKIAASFQFESDSPSRHYYNDNDFNLDDKTLNEIVEKHNITGKLVGHGTFCYVYSDGKVATKITSSKRDYENLIKLYDLKESLPERMQKYIIDIYDHDFDEEFGVYVLSVELLRPLDKIPELKYIFEASFSDSAPEKFMPRIKALLGSRQYVTDLFKKSMTHISRSVPKEFVSKIASLEWRIIQRINSINTEKIKFDGTLIDMLNKIEDIINNIIDDSIYEAKIEIEDGDSINLKITKETFINEVKRSVEYGTHLPMSYNMLENFSNSIEHVPGFSGFVKFLKYLATKNIRYDDVRSCNVMIRPHTNDLVISDPGLFSII